MAERSAVNRNVVGSSPTWGATGAQTLFQCLGAFFVHGQIGQTFLWSGFVSGLALRVLKKRYIVEVHFHVTKDNHIFCTAYENYGDVFRSKNALYSIDLNDMSAKKYFR